MSKGKVVGIDLGTTYSSIAHVNKYGKPELIPNAEGNLRTPSVIMFEDDYILVGEVAKAHAIAVPDKIVEFVKREMGKSKEQFSREFNGKEYSAEELSALILKTLKNDAEEKLKEDITDAVITVPADFGDSERQATRRAGEIAGFNVLQVVNDPTAAARAYGIDTHGNDQTVFVFDLGSGVFDVTIMKVSGLEMQMIAINGDHRLGGKDWDDQIISYVAETFESEHGVNPLEDSYAYQEIQRFAIEGKEYLSRLDKYRISCSYDGKNINIELTREKFEELTADLVDKCSALCEVVLSESEMTWGDIDEVLLVGGSTRMPMVQEMLTKISGKTINAQLVNPDEAVALGAAIIGNFIRGIGVVPSVNSDAIAKEDIQFTVLKIVNDIVTHNLGLVVHGSDEAYVHVIFPKGTPVPCEVTVEYKKLYDVPLPLQILIVQRLEQGQREDDFIKFEDYKLGELFLDLPFGLSAGALVRVTYKCNLDQTLEVTAKGPDGRTTLNVMIDRPTLDDTEVADATQHLQSLEVE